MTNTPPQVATILWLQNLTKPYNFCELIHFCQGLKRHHILKQDELDTSDLSLVISFFTIKIQKMKKISINSMGIQNT